jgi:hypothetical protein
VYQHLTWSCMPVNMDGRNCARLRMADTLSYMQRYPFIVLRVTIARTRGLAWTPTQRGQSGLL